MSLNIELLEQSFEQIKPRADEFVASFHENLFAAHPEVKPLFASIDPIKQQKNLLDALVLVVENLRNPNALGEALNLLGASYVSDEAIHKYYPAMGQALLLSFEQYLQPNWTPELAQAWSEAYSAITAQVLQKSVQKNGTHTAEVEPSKPETISDHQRAGAAIAEVSSTIPDASAQAEVEATSALAISELPIELLEKSFEKIRLRAEEFATSFYENLFQAHPEVKPLFAQVEMAQQQKKLIDALVLVVENLGNPSALAPVLSALGARHIGYGSLPKQYPAVGQALLLTLEQYLQDDWTPELKKAWKQAYGTITAQMLKGAAQQAPSKTTQAKKTAQAKGTTAEKTIPSEASTTSETFKQRSSQFWTKTFNPQWRTFPKQVLGQAVDAFWAGPAWLVAILAAVSWLGIAVVVDDNSLVAELLEAADTASLVVALVLFIKEAPDRRKQFHYQAWGTIDAAHGVKVSYARILALQDLNEDGVPLRGLDAPGAELTAIQLPKANLSHANLTEADLSNADLSGANLNKATLNQIKLSGAKLSGANLSFAQLSRANLSSATLSSANLICADLSNANLSGADLRNASLSGANLAGAYLTGANLKGAKVSASELSAAFLEGAIMPDS